jgi:hypothetical protein
VILPGRESEGICSIMGVHSLLACGRGCLSFTVSAGMDSRLIMVALNSECNFWCRSNGHINVSKNLTNISAISQILA